MTNNLIKTAPVTSLTTVESVVAALLTFLLAHGVIGNVDASTVTQALAPLIALALPALFGALKWRLVTPAHKVETLLESSGLLSDADLARIEGLLHEIVPDLLGGIVTAEIGHTSIADMTTLPTIQMPTTFTASNSTSVTTEVDTEPAPPSAQAGAAPEVTPPTS